MPSGTWAYVVESAGFPVVVVTGELVHVAVERRQFMRWYMPYRELAAPVPVPSRG